MGTGVRLAQPLLGTRVVFLSTTVLAHSVLVSSAIQCATAQPTAIQTVNGSSQDNVSRVHTGEDESPQLVFLDWTADPDLISPRVADGRRDVCVLSLSLGVLETEALGELTSRATARDGGIEIRCSAKFTNSKLGSHVNAVQSTVWLGRPFVAKKIEEFPEATFVKAQLEVVWDGRDPDGNFVPDGKYACAIDAQAYRIAIESDGTRSEIAVSEVHAAIDTVEIDNTLPEVLIDGVDDGECGVGFSPQIQVTDVNLAEQSFELSGKPYVTGTPIVHEADYLLRVAAMDRAGNRRTVTRTLVVDRTAPVVQIDGITSNVLCRDAQLVWRATDAHLDSTIATLNDEPVDSTIHIVEDGHYELMVRAVDCAGTASVHVERFTLDKTPPDVVVISPRDGSIINETHPTIVVYLVEGFSGVDLRSFSARLDNEDISDRFVVFERGVFSDLAGLPALPSGPHTLDVSVLDNCGRKGASGTVNFHVSNSDNETSPRIAPIRPKALSGMSP